MPISAEERRAIGLTLAGEIDPRMSPYSDPTTAVEAANILATIENRFQANTPRAFGKAKAKSYATRVDVAKQPKQYSTWNQAESRAVAKANYSKFGPEIDGIVDGFYNGTVKPSVPDATHYYSPSAMAATEGKKAPGWAKSMKGVVQQGAHVFGTIEGARKAKSLPEVGPVPTPADPVRMAMAAAPRGLLDATPAAPVQAAGLLARPAPSPALGLLGPPQPAVGASAALAQMAAASPATQSLSSIPARPVSAVATPNRVASVATPVASSLAPSMARAAPAGLLSSAQESNLADRLGAPEQALEGQPKATPARLAPGTMLTANAMVAPAPNNRIASPAPRAPAVGIDAELEKQERNIAAGLAAQRAPVQPAAAQPFTPSARPALAPENPAALAPALAPAVNVPSRQVASVPAAIEAAQPAPSRPRGLSSAPSMPGLSGAAGLGAPSVPDAPGFGAQVAAKIGNAFDQNKGRMIGGLLGNMVAGPVGGLLGGYVGNRVQQGNTPQMSNQARGAIEDGNFDGFSHGVNKNAGLLGGLFGGGGLLGGMFGGGLGAPSVPGAPTGARNYGLGGGGGPSMSSAARSAMDSGSFDGFSHSGSTQNNNTSKSSSSKGSKSSGGKKK